MQLEEEKRKHEKKRDELFNQIVEPFKRLKIQLKKETSVTPAHDEGIIAILKEKQNEAYNRLNTENQSRDMIVFTVLREIQQKNETGIILVQTTIGTCFNELIDLLNKGGFSDREDAMEELIKIGKPAIGSLLKIVKGKGIRSDYAVEILGNIGNWDVFDVLMTALKDWCRTP